MKTQMTLTLKKIEWAIEPTRNGDQSPPRHRMTRSLGMLIHINMPASMTHSRKEAAV
jgi:hypothetical protein